MRILVLNAGSSSIKVRLLELPEGITLARALVEKIGEPMGRISTETQSGTKRIELPIEDHREGLATLLGMLQEDDAAQLQRIPIRAVGHRVVHGGERFVASALVTAEVIAAITATIPLAPLHNPSNLVCITAMMELLPEVPQVAVFDTAFHHTIPERAYLYALPYPIYQQRRVRRYGFHGTSHRYVATAAAQWLNIPLDTAKIITCHLGNGASVTAIAEGNSVDTSMGFTPVEGLVMGTRCGDVDPAIPLFLQKQLLMSAEQTDHLLNRKSGLLGLSGLSNDMRDLLRARLEGHEGATRALDVFVYRLRKYIGAYIAVLGGLDVLVFTGGIGEHAAEIRDEVTRGMDWAGIVLDPEKNRGTAGGILRISADTSRVFVLVVPTDEEVAIARDTYALVRGEGPDVG